MIDKLNGVGLLADLLDDVARLTRSRLMFPLVVLMIASIWIVAGCYAVLRPEKRVEINRRMRWLGSNPSSVRAIGFIELLAGFLGLGVSATFSSDGDALAVESHRGYFSVPWIGMGHMSTVRVL